MKVRSEQHLNTAELLGGRRLVFYPGQTVPGILVLQMNTDVGDCEAFLTRYAGVVGGEHSERCVSDSGGVKPVQSGSVQAHSEGGSLHSTAGATQLSAQRALPIVLLSHRGTEGEVGFRLLFTEPAQFNSSGCKPFTYRAYNLFMLTISECL